MAMRDTDVEIRGDSLADKKILLGVSGGIAAVDTVRLARELRRHGANVSVMMTHSAQKIISPLAVEWATQTEVITNWESDLSALETVDGILIAPATRDLLASYLHGLQHGPILMALSAARTRKCPVMMIPSMHADLADDPITSDLDDEVDADIPDVSSDIDQVELEEPQDMNVDSAVTVEDNVLDIDDIEIDLEENQDIVIDVDDTVLDLDESDSTDDLGEELNLDDIQIDLDEE